MLIRCILFAVCLLNTANALAATLSGRVLDSGNNEPLAGATVVFSRMVAFFPKEVERSTVGADGRFSFEIPATARYQVSAFADGFLGDSRTINLDVNISVADFDLILSESASIVVTLRDAVSGEAVGDSRVFFARPGSGSSVTSDANGQARRDNLAAGDYWVCVEDPTDHYRNQCAPDYLLPHGNSRSEAPTVAVASGQTLQINMNLVQGAEIGGTVNSTLAEFDTIGRRLSCSVRDAQTGTFDFCEVLVDGNRNYRVRGLPDGAYHLTFGGFELLQTYIFHWRRVLFRDLPCDLGCNPADATTIQTSLLAAATDIDFELDPGAVIKGRVTSAIDGTPLSGITIRVYEYSVLGLGLIRTVTTDDDGRYLLGGLDPESLHAIGTSNTLGYINQGWPATLCYVNCSNGEALALDWGLQGSDFDFSLYPGLVFSGRSGLVPERTAMDATIHLLDASGHALAMVWTGDHGGYQLPAVPPGDYFLMARTRFLLPNLCLDYLGQACTLIELPPAPSFIQVSGPGAQAGIDFDFQIRLHADGFE